MRRRARATKPPWIPQGSRNKYELDKPTGLFRLDRVLPSAVHYPGGIAAFRSITAAMDRYAAQHPAATA